MPKKVAIAKGVVKSAKDVAKSRKKPGASNLGDYASVSAKGFAGSTPGTFPINTVKRAKSALKLAHNDPNPSSVKAKVYSKYPSLKKKA